jgi:hypothetical protein
MDWVIVVAVDGEDVEIKKNPGEVFPIHAVIVREEELVEHFLVKDELVSKGNFFGSEKGEGGFYDLFWCVIQEGVVQGDKELVFVVKQNGVRSKNMVIGKQESERSTKGFGVDIYPSEWKVLLHFFTEVVFRSRVFQEWLEHFRR